MEIRLLQQEIALHRNENAYRKLFLHFYDGLYHFANSYVRQNESAEEIVSDVMMKVWTMKERLLEIQNLKIYLFTLTKNSALNTIKRDHKYRNLTFPEISAEQHVELNTPENITITRELSGRIDEMVKGLPPKCRMVYQLVKHEGCSYKEVAQIMGISVNTVDRHLGIATRTLAEKMKGYL